MKKLIKSPRQVVAEMLEGVVAVTPGLALLENEDQGVAFMLENLNVQADHPRAPFALAREPGTGEINYAGIGNALKKIRRDSA